MKYKNLIFIIIFVLTNLCALTTEAQKGYSIIIYADKQDYLLPTIEKKLLGLKDSKTKFSIIKSVSNLNRAASNKNNEIALNQTVKYYSNINFPVTTSIQELQNPVAEYLIKNDLFLQISVNTINNLLEYQLSLYKIQRKDQDFPVIDIRNPLRIHNFFVNIEKEDFDKKIGDAIKVLFPESNILPIARISVEGFKEYYRYLDREILLDLELELLKNDTTALSKQIFEHRKFIEETKDQTIQYEREFLNQRKKYYVPINQDITMSSYLSSDSDTPFDKLEFSWRNITDKEHKLYPSEFKINSVGNEIRIQFFQEKKSLWQLNVNDGVSVVSDTCEIISVAKPVLFVKDKTKPTIDIAPNSLINSRPVKNGFSSFDFDLYVLYKDSLDIDKFILTNNYLKIDTSDIEAYYRGLEEYAKKKEGRNEYSQFTKSTQPNKYKLNITQYNSAEGSYKVNYINRGLVSESKSLNINTNISKIRIGLFSVEINQYSSKLGDNKFNETEYSAELRVLKYTSIYYSQFYNSSAKYKTYDIVRSNEFGVKFPDGISAISYRKKLFTEFSTGLYLKNYFYSDSTTNNQANILGVSMQNRFSKLFFNRGCIYLNVGIKAGIQLTRPMNKDMVEIRFFYGLGLSL